MAQTYKQIQKQIEQLQKRADALRDSEIKGVVDRIKVAIAHYGLTAAHLGLGSGTGGARSKATIKSARKSKAKSSAAFSDGSGNVWSGRGPRPRWLRDALTAGRSIEEFRVGAAPSASAPAAVPTPVFVTADSNKTVSKTTAKKSKRAPSKVTYTDGAGNSWTGRGPRPGWLKAALESGKSLEDFLK
jgi:DNA-binding protein H-NS